MTEVASGEVPPQIRGVTRSVLLPLALGAALLFGCAGAEAGPAEAPQAPPSVISARWDGIYQGPYHIYLRIQTHGDQAVGTWRALGERNGELKGKIKGDTLFFAWTEEASDGTWSGRGSFVYAAAKSKDGRAELLGRYGLGARSTGGNWYAFKRTDLPMDTKVSSLLDAGADEPDQVGNCLGGCDEVELGEE